MPSREPIHVTLRKYRIIHVSVIGFLMWLTADMWKYIVGNLTGLTDWQAGAISGAFTALIAGLFAAAKDSRRTMEKDGDK